MTEASKTMQVIHETRGAVVCLVFFFPPHLDADTVKQMASEVDRAMAAKEDLRLVLDFSDTKEIAAGAFTSPHGLTTSLNSVGPVKRYAVVDAPDIAAKAVEVFGAALPLEARSFEKGELEAARSWAFAMP